MLMGRAKMHISKTSAVSKIWFRSLGKWGFSGKSVRVALRFAWF